MSWKNASPAAKSRRNATKAAQRRARYRYVKNVLGAPSWKARECQHSVLALQAYFPDISHPPEMVAIHKPGPKPRG